MKPYFNKIFGPDWKGKNEFLREFVETLKKDLADGD